MDVEKSLKLAARQYKNPQKAGLDERPYFGPLRRRCGGGRVRAGRADDELRLMREEERVRRWRAPALGALRLSLPSRVASPSDARASIPLLT